MASVRLRMLLPMRELAARGLPVSGYDKSLGVAAYRTLVFSKSLTREGLHTAQQARLHGCRVIYDLCDNLYDSQPGRRLADRLCVLEEFFRIADLVVLSTPVLRAQMLDRHPGLASRSLVIPDALEPEGGTPGWLGRWQLGRLRGFLGRYPGALHCVWFGKNQGQVAGLDHAQSAVEQLEAFGRAHPVTFTVISNQRSAYKSASRAWRIPHHYLPWSPATFAPALRAHQVALIPVRRNAYTVGKSINRPATAIMAGLGVVGDSIDSYEELQRFVMFDRWQEGLCYYADNPPARDARLAEARAYLADRYGIGRIAQLWQEVLELDPAHQAR
jgi:hypothetical protein